MDSLSLTEAFIRYGASIANPRWAVSAEARDGAIVACCWSDSLRSENGRLIYADRLSRWGYTNTAARNLLRKHLALAAGQGRLIRLVIADAEDTGTIEIGKGISLLNRRFSIRPDLVGRVVEFDGDRFVLEFEQVG